VAKLEVRSVWAAGCIVLLKKSDIINERYYEAPEKSLLLP
jgi:hypothetical protein